MELKRIITLLISCILLAQLGPVLSLGSAVEDEDILNPPVYPQHFSCFTENAGQWDESIRFIGTTSFGHVAFMDDGILLNSPFGSWKDEMTEGFNQMVHFVGPDGVCPVGVEAQEFRSSFFLGNDPSQHSFNVISYEKVLYPNLWPGIDLEYGFRNGYLKYDLRISPWADPEDIRFQVSGGSRIKLENDKLMIETGSGIDYIDEGLSTFYSGTSVPIGSEYVKLRDNIYSFRLDGFDRSREVTIDPIINSTYLGGAQSEVINRMVSNGKGDLVLCGTTSSSNFPTTQGCYQSTHGGNSDVVILKINATTMDLELSTYIGGSGNDVCQDVEVDRDGGIFATGFTGSNDFPTTSGCFDSTFNAGWRDVFLVKMDGDGKKLNFSTYIGGNERETGFGLELGDDGSIYICGITNSDDFPTTQGAYDTTHSPKQPNVIQDVFVLKMLPNGTALNYSTFVHGTQTDFAYDMAIDGEGNAYVTGSTISSSFPKTSGAYDTTMNGGFDVILFKLNYTGSSLDYSTLIGGSYDDEAYAIEIDDLGNAYITGKTTPDLTYRPYPTTSGAYDTTFSGQSGTYDMFFTKMNPTGTALIYSTLLGDVSNDIPYDLELDENGDPIIIGYTYSRYFPVMNGSFDPTKNGGYDVVLVNLNITNSKLQYSTFIGGSGDDIGRCLWYDRANKLVYLSGSTASTDFPTTIYAYDASSNGNDDIFIIKMDMLLYPDPPINLSYRIGDGFVNLTWDPPISNGSEPILYYTIYKGVSPQDLDLFRTTGIGTNFNDTSVVNGIEYYYCLTANSSLGESLMSDILIVNDTEPPKMVNDMTSLAASTGDSFTFSVEVSDNVKVEGVDLLVWFDGDDRMNLSAERMPGGEWNLTIFVEDNRTGKVNYNVTAFDPSFNWLSIPTMSVPIFDNDLPVLLEDPTDVIAYSSENFTFRARIIDNLGVGSSWVLYSYNQGDKVNLSLDPAGEEVWSRIIVIEDLIGNLTYRLLFKDVDGNVNMSEEVTVDILDRIFPTFGPNLTKDSASTGDPFDIMIRVSDNVEIDTVLVEYWFSNDEHQMLGLLSDDEESWGGQIMIGTSELWFNYLFRANDTSGNEIVSETTNITVGDNDLPEILNITSPESLTTADPFTITIETRDNIGIVSAMMTYWYDPSDKNHTYMTRDGPMNWSASLTARDTQETFSFQISVFDPSGNFNRTTTRTLEVMDNDNPTIVVTSLPSYTNTSDLYEITCKVFDNIEVLNCSLEYWFGNGTPVPLDPSSTIPQFRFEIGIPSDSLDALHLVLISYDINGNRNTSEVYDIEVRDSINPSLDPVGDITTYETLLINVTVHFSDNIGVTDVIWSGSPVDTEFDMMHGIANAPGTYNVLVVVTDGAGNNATIGFTIIILPEDHDKDLDGIPDLVEMDWGLDYESGNDALLDPDDDGLTNIEEYRNGTYINLNDTDMDGMLDGWEVLYGLDPLTFSAEKDTDGDGISDLDEYLNGTDPTVKEKKEGGGGLFIVIIVVVVVVIIVAVVLFFILRRKKGEEVEVAPPEEEGASDVIPEDQAPPEPSFDIPTEEEVQEGPAPQESGEIVGSVEATVSVTPPPSEEVVFQSPPVATGQMEPPIEKTGGPQGQEAPKLQEGVIPP